MTNNYDSAFARRANGVTVVPQKARDIKYPAVMWKGLQSRQVTDA